IVLTGEGSFDSQSLGGKVVAAVRDRAPASARVIVVAGRVGLSPAECRQSGITAALSIAAGPADLDTLPERAEAHTEHTAAHACALVAAGMGGTRQPAPPRLPPTQIVSTRNAPTSHLHPPY